MFKKNSRYLTEKRGTPLEVNDIIVISKKINSFSKQSKLLFNDSTKTTKIAKSTQNFYTKAKVLAIEKSAHIKIQLIESRPNTQFMQNNDVFRIHVELVRKFKGVNKTE